MVITWPCSIQRMWLLFSKIKGNSTNRSLLPTMNSSNLHHRVLQFFLAPTKETTALPLLQASTTASSIIFYSRWDRMAQPNSGETKSCMIHNGRAVIQINRSKRLSPLLTFGTVHQMASVSLRRQIRQEKSRYGN